MGDSRGVDRMYGQKNESVVAIRCRGWERKLHMVDVSTKKYEKSNKNAAPVTIELSRGVMVEDYASTKQQQGQVDGQKSL